MSSKLPDEIDCELLRPLEYICSPDPRSPRPDTDSLFGSTIETHHQRIAEINLNDSVPRDILIQFETAKNLQLYAWLIYRFYPVAQHQALACLELALRTRFENEIPKKGKNSRLFLSDLLDHAINTKAINNEGFSAWHYHNHVSAHTRYEQQKIQEMHENGLTSIELNENEVEIIDEDKNFDYVKLLKKSLLGSRNHHAHGSTMLHNQTLGTIRIIAEIINQIYPPQ